MDYKEMTLVELRELAREKGIEVLQDIKGRTY